MIWNFNRFTFTVTGRSGLFGQWRRQRSEVAFELPADIRLAVHSDLQKLKESHEVKDQSNQSRMFGTTLKWGRVDAA